MLTSWPTHVSRAALRSEAFVRMLFTQSAWQKHGLRLLLRGQQQWIANVRTRAYIMQQQASRQNDDAAAAHDNIEAEIPRKISRSSTAILRALESTVDRDETSAGYKYVDDPYFIPVSQRGKRDNALAKDSGKRAAHFIIQKYPELFQRMYADPAVPSLLPKPLLALDPQPDSEVRNALVRASRNIPDLPKIVPPLPVSYETLRYLLEAGDYADAYRYYDKLRVQKFETGAVGAEKPLSIEEKQKFLEGLCFYNSGNKPADDYLEERYFSATFLSDKIDNVVNRPRWNTASGADRVFQDICNELTSDDGASMQLRNAAYSAMICGTVEYMFYTRSLMLFEEMLTKNMRPPVQVFNAMIQIVPYIRDSSESRWEYIMYLFNKMAELNVRPDVLCFNSALEILARNTIWRNAQECAVRCLDEMHAAGVEPSLATWNFLLQTFYRSRNYNNPVLANDVIRNRLTTTRSAGGSFNADLNTRTDPKVLDDTTNNDTSLVNGLPAKRGQPASLFDRPPVDVRDFRFLMETMRLLCDRLHDGPLAIELHALTEKYGDNYSSGRLFDEALRENIYYFSYLCVLCESAMPLQEFFQQHYDKLVPTRYIPEVNLITVMLRTAELQGQYRHVPRIWSDTILFQHANNERIVGAVLDVMTSTPVDLLNGDEDWIDKNTKAASLRDGYYEIANDIRKRCQDNIEKEMYRLNKASTEMGVAGAAAGADEQSMQVVGMKEINAASGMNKARLGIAGWHSMQAYTGQNRGMMMVMLLRTGHYGEAVAALREFIEDRKSILGKPVPAHLRELAEACIVQRDVAHLRIVCDYLRESDMQEDVMEELSSFITTGVALSDAERAVMNSILQTVN